MEIICLDLEGVLIPEIWVNFAEITGIEEFRLTTREVPDYDQLMKRRLQLLEQHQLGLPDIQKVISQLKPLPGAIEFVEWIREHFQLMILSDTYYEFAKPLMKQLNWPTLLCHRLEANESGKVTNYVLRQKNAKKEVVSALQALNYRVMAAGDSYNDTAMLVQADKGFFFCAPEKVTQEFPQFTCTSDYEELKKLFIDNSQYIRV